MVGVGGFTGFEFDATEAIERLLAPAFAVRTEPLTVSDAGLLHGASTFTTMLGRNGKVFRIDRHLSITITTMVAIGAVLAALIKL